MIANIIKYCGKTYNRKDFEGDDLAWELYIAERKAKDYAEFALEKLDKKKLAKKIEKINKRYQKTNLKSNISKKPSNTKPVMIEVALESVIKAEPVEAKPIITVSTVEDNKFYCSHCNMEINDHRTEWLKQLTKEQLTKLSKLICTKCVWN